MELTMNNEESEAFMYYTVNDALDVINSLGLNNFLMFLFEQSKQRALTIEELEAMQVLHDNWNL
tara:strand:+ start:1057 stop:1248 length:192 start_codon:yes stop_codon:yes gene_type:complete